VCRRGFKLDGDLKEGKISVESKFVVYFSEETGNASISAQNIPDPGQRRMY